MREKAVEIMAGIITVATLGAATFYPFFEEAQSVKGRVAPGTEILTLTAVAATGTWTEEAVTGGNYWFRSFPAARPVFHLGKPTLLRLKSSDVVHSFYCPGLGTGQIPVYPGRVSELLVTPTKEGVFEYYCTTICGEPHFGMRGEAVVIREGAPVPPPAGLSARSAPYWLDPPMPAGRKPSEHGRWLFHRQGCFSCHGESGKGGVQNWNYVKDVVPPLNTLAQRMLIPDKEGADAIVETLERREGPQTLSGHPPFARYPAFLAQYQSVKDLIRKGNPPGKKDPNGLPPPLEMPSFAARLSDLDIDDLIAYLLRLQPWEADEK